MKSSNETGNIRTFLGKKQKSFEFHSVHEFESKDLKKVIKPCASASLLSGRGKLMLQQQNYETFSSEFSRQSFKIYGMEDQKLFLSSYQILEKMNKLISKVTNIKSYSCSHENHLECACAQISFRKLILYRDNLKQLLEERCTLILKEECDFCVKESLNMICDFKHIYINEKMKMTSLPIQSFNRFIDSSDLSISVLELFLKKLQMICDLHLSLSSSYQKIINFFHVSFSMDLYQIVLKTNKMLQKLKSEIFYWAHKILAIYMQKLCLADPNSVSPNFLQDVLEIYKVFNVIISDNEKVMRQKYLKAASDLFYDSVVHYECKKLPFSIMLQYLSLFEAKVAAERIVQFLIGMCKHFKLVNFQKKDSFNHEWVKVVSATSDYCSGSASDVISENVLAESPKPVSNFLNVLFSLMQRNQSFVLKYLYAIMNVKNISSHKSRTKHLHEKTSKLSSVRQTWSLPLQVHEGDSYIHLEEIYWSHFWNNTEKFILKLLLQVPYHQYGAAAAGAIILWPESYRNYIIHILQMSIKNEDISPESRVVMNQISNYIFAYSLQISWDRDFCLSLSAVQVDNCVPVPTVQNEIRTHTGNLFSDCLTQVTRILNNDVHDMELLIYLKCILQIQATLDCFNLWLTVRTRALVSSWNLSMYMLISFSDCRHAAKLLKSREIPGASTDKHSVTSKIIPSTKHKLESSVLKQVKDLESKMYGPVSVEEMLFPLTESLNHIADVSPIIIASTSAIAEAFLHFLYKCKRSLSAARNVSFISAEALKFLLWVKNLPEPEKGNIAKLESVQKLCSVVELIQSLASASRSCLKRNNQVLPSPSLGIYPERNTEFTEQEKRDWHSLRMKYSFLSCFKISL
ncbi:uncharacterized protein LOC118193196 isoform X2 [Stegodyphus dumicola]|uniref:uncharacterized protein LOC118193196 isoform X2 n=1 Tax=Stegodyphus dumicola TaxID=202533 RepID=UPI0015AA7F2A|nr:uncharacterized protein LOC118193196 isoform X2 [Stegodyphus dumicola]